MIWLSKVGGYVSRCPHMTFAKTSPNRMEPIGSPIATTSIAGYTWELWKGTNQGWTVFSFLRQGSDIKNFSADLNGFYQYLIDYQGVESSQYLVALESGTEPVTVSGPHSSSYQEIADHWTGIGHSCHEFVQRCGKPLVRFAGCLRCAGRPRCIF